MLLAFAVENLLKAAAVARNSIKYKQSFRATHKFPKELQSHDLFELATHVGLILQGHDEDLLRRLTRSAVWFGRYPAPLRHSDMAGTVRFADGNDYSVSWFGANDVEELNALVLGLPARLGFSNEEWGHAT